MEKTAKTESRLYDEFETEAWRVYGEIAGLRERLGELEKAAEGLADVLEDDALADRLALQTNHIYLAADAVNLAYNVFDEVGV